MQSNLGFLSTNGHLYIGLLFSLLQAPVVYSCVAGVEGGRGIGGREKGRGGGVGKRVPFHFFDASDFAIRRNSS